MKNNLINTRISDTEKKIMLEKSKKMGFKNLSEYLRFVGINAEIEVKVRQ
jgi:hypothetical protein